MKFFTVVDRNFLPKRSAFYHILKEVIAVHNFTLRSNSTFFFHLCLSIQNRIFLRELLTTISPHSLLSGSYKSLISPSLISCSQEHDVINNYKITRCVIHCFLRILHLAQVQMCYAATYPQIPRAHNPCPLPSSLLPCLTRKKAGR